MPPPTITIETWVEGDMAAVAITDNGPGVPAPLSSRIFDPFFTTKPRGPLEREAAPASGARFVCRLPLGRRSPPSRPSLGAS